jgi:O-antigen/teichoic acid export membrane protein
VTRHDRRNKSESLHRGASVVAGCHLLSQVISFVTLALLYRLLLPEDFGLFALALVAINLARILASWGLGIASVQDQSLTNAEQSAIWYRGTWHATAVALVLALGSFFAVEWSTWRVLSLLALTLPAAAIGAQHQAQIERKLQLGRLAILRVVSQAAGAAMAVVLALGQFGVTALATQQLVEWSLLAGLLWIVEPWRPNLRHSNTPINRHVKFGSYFTASNLMFWITQNADTLIVGMFGGKFALGLYSQAYSMAMRPVLLVTTPVTAAMLPTLARDIGRPADYERRLLDFYRFVAMLLLPCSVGLFIVAEDVMVLLGGETWRPSGVLLRCLSPVIAVQGFINIASSVFASAGRADRLFAGSVVIALVLCQAFLSGWWLGEAFGPPPIGGPLGLSIGYSAASVFVIFLPYLWFCTQTVGVRLRCVLQTIAKPLKAAMLMGIAVWAIHSATPQTALSTPVLRLATSVATGIIVYGLLMRREIIAILHGNRPD